MTLDESDKQLLIKALWDEQILYVQLLKKMIASPEQEVAWEERLQRLTAMTVQLGGSAVRS